MKFTLTLVLLMLTATALRGRTDALANSLTIYTQFAQPPSHQIIEYMKTELESAMQPFHRRVIWRSLDRADGHEAAAEIMVVTFKGDCRMDARDIPRGPRGPLGWTHIADGEILPFADVDCDQVRDLLHSVWLHVMPGFRDAVFGRALARVLAHELYHYLTHSTRHASTGIAKATYSAADLVANSMVFDQAQLHNVLAGAPHSAVIQHLDMRP